MDLDETSIRCFICHDYKGLLADTDEGWAHYTCVNYIPEISFEDDYK